MPKTTVKDPVCGMELEPRKGMDKSEYKGQVFYFCWAGCKEKFDQNPEKFVGQTTDHGSR
jgi:YHS domain-containing protein